MTRLDDAFWAIVSDLDAELEAGTQDRRGRLCRIARALPTSFAALLCMAPCSTMALVIATRSKGRET
jgi:hypothetical protein